MNSADDSMAPLSTTKQKHGKHGSMQTRKDSSIPNSGNASGCQDHATKATQSSNKQGYFNVPRKWSTWPNLDSLAQKIANVGTAHNTNSSTQLSPMERWRMETVQQSPWDNIAAVNACLERQPSEFGLWQRDGTQGGDTDSGTWWP